MQLFEALARGRGGGGAQGGAAGGRAGAGRPGPPAHQARALQGGADEGQLRQRGNWRQCCEIYIVKMLSLINRMNANTFEISSNS